jgi:hypothetical protein
MRLPFEEDELPTLLGIGCFFGTIALLFAWQAAPGTTIVCNEQGCDIIESRFFDKTTDHIALADLRDANVREYRDEDRAAIYKLELTTTGRRLILAPDGSEHGLARKAERLKTFAASPTGSLKLHIGPGPMALDAAIALFVIGFFNIIIFNARRRMKAAAVRRHKVG